MKTDPRKRKEKISIVFEDTGEDGGAGFNVYLTGQTRNIMKVAEKDRTGAEHWAAQCMKIVVDVLQQCGVVKNTVHGGGTKH